MSLVIEGLSLRAMLSSGESVNIIENMNITVPMGEKLALMGHSGSGKTMCALAIMGLLPKNISATGSIIFDGIDLLKISTKERQKLLGTTISYIPQSASDFLNPALKIKTQMWEAFSKNNIPKYERYAIAKNLLDSLSLFDTDAILNSYPFLLSGGMAQRVSMAISAISVPRLLIADEATKGLDRQNTKLFMDNLDRLFPDATILFITHDLSLTSYCDKLVHIENGKIIGGEL